MKLFPVLESSFSRGWHEGWCFVVTCLTHSPRQRNINRFIHINASIKLRKNDDKEEEMKFYTK